MTEEDFELIKLIRNEANNVKDCFTKFSFQAIAFSAIILSAIANYQPTQPFVGFAGLLVIIVVLTVAKIGNYKYGTANRHFGYELFLSLLSSNKAIGLKPNYRIGWEEALRAWRIVQSSIFEKIYVVKTNTNFWNIILRWNYNRYNPDFKKKLPKEIKKQNDLMWWFEPGKVISLTNPSSKFYPGRYLQTMQSILHSIAFLSMLPLLIMTLQFQYSNIFEEFAFLNNTILGMKVLTFISLNFIVIILFFLLFRIRQTISRRHILETGLLSIHSCAFMWHVVYISHKRAIEKVDGDQFEYLKELSKVTIDASQNIFSIYRWMTNNNLENINK